MPRTTATLVTATLGLGLSVALVWGGAQARLRGKIVDSAKKPIPTAAITITTSELENFDKKVEVKADGSYSTLILDATKRYTLNVSAPGYLPQTKEFKVAVGTADNVFDFTLKTEKEMQQEQRAEMLEQPGYKELKQGMDLLTAGKLEEAEAMLEQARTQIPDPLPVWVALADISARRGDNAKALERARKCLELDAEDARCLAIAANAAKELGDTAAHNEYLTRYQQANPDDPAAFFNQAAEYLNKMDDEHARPLLEGCLKADPAFAKCLFEYGMLLLRTGDTEGAKANLQKYIEVIPEGEDAVTARETIKYL